MQLISTLYFILICYLYVLKDNPLLLKKPSPVSWNTIFSMLSSPIRLTSDWRHRLPWVFIQLLLSPSTPSRRRK